MENMEKHVLKRIFFVILFLFINSAFSESLYNEEKVRISLWAQLDAYPGLENSSALTDNVFSYPISRLKKIAPFLLEGMVCGWSFSYTPYDNARNVSEYFEFKPLFSLNELGQNISYKNPWIQDDRLYCWVEYECTPQVAAWRNAWRTSEYRRISGSGTGSLAEGFDGIEQAAREALKLAVRNYARTITKNKPREIIGEVLITGNPELGIKSGRYTIELDFFLNIDKIIWYNVY